LKIAVYTMVKNEPIMLPLWLKYYSRYFDDLYVFNNNTSDGSVGRAHKKFKFTEYKVTEDVGFKLGAMVKMGKEGQKKIFDMGYDIVIFAESDEFILADPNKYSGLDEFVLGMKEDYVYATGREVFQRDEEKAIDWDKPILAQRSIWWPHPSYHKPTISKVLLDWADGFHYLESEVEIASKIGLGLGEHIKEIACPDVFMVHLQKIDWDAFCGRGRFRKDKAHFHIGMNEKMKIPEKWKKVL